MCTRDTGYQEVMDRCPDEVRVASLSLLAKALGEQMTASRLEKNLSVPSLFLIAGAAYLAGLAAGFWKNTAEIKGFWAVDKKFVPVMAYRQAEALYRGWKAAVARALT